MGRAFIASSTQFLEVSAAPAVGVTIGLFAWGKMDNLTNNNTIFCESDTATDNYFIELDMVGGVGGDPQRLGYKRVGLNAFPSTGVAYTVDLWHAIQGNKIGTASHDIYLDGGNRGTDTTSIAANPEMDNISIGALRRLTPASFTDGDVAHCAIWNVSLRETEDVLPLAHGVSPFVIRNDALVFYAPVDGNLSPEPDYISQNNLTLGNSPTKATTNPPVEFLGNYM